MAAFDPWTYDGLILNDWPPNSYPQAPSSEAMPGVYNDIQLYKSQPELFRSNNILLWTLLGSSTQPLKQGQDDSAYVDRSRIRGQYCQNCIFGYYRAVGGKMICSQIRGFIKPLGWCKWWIGP